MVFQEILRLVNFKYDSDDWRCILWVLMWLLRVLWAVGVLFECIFGWCEKIFLQNDFVF